MQKPLYYIASLFVLLSCKMTADNVAGIYQQENRTSRLILKKDKTFEYAGDKSALIEPGSPPTSDNLNFLTRGTWEFGSNHVKLHSRDSDSLSVTPAFTDSITRFTSITSFNFWNRYGDPVSIRSIRFLKSKTKPHFGNTLFLFAQDFQRADTLVFQLAGYPDFSYPGSIPYAIGNNTHKIILHEPYRAAVFNNTVFIPKRNKLLSPQNDIVFTKKN